MSITELIDDYSYILVKISAAKAKMVSYEQMMKLIESRDMSEFKNILSNIEQDISPSLINSSKDLEKSFHGIFFDYLETLIKNSPRECQEFLLKYLQKYELENLKDLVVGKLIGIDANTIRERIFLKVEDILHTTEIIEDAIKMDSLKEVIFLYRKTQYHELLHELESRYEATGELFFIYALLDRFYIQDFNNLLHEHAKWRSIEKKIARFFIGTLTDSYNLNIVLRGINHDFQWGEIELLLVDGKHAYVIGEDKLQDLYKIGKNKDEIFKKVKNYLENYTYSQKALKVLKKSMLIHSIRTFYHNLTIAYFNTLKFKSGHELSEVIAFMIRKEVEIDNLVTIMEGVKNNYDRDKLKKYLIKEVV